MPSTTRKILRDAEALLRPLVEIRRLAEGAGACAEPAPSRAAEGAELGIADPRGDVGELQRALHQIAMGQAAPRVVEEAQEGCAFSLQPAMQTARGDAELLGDVFGAEAPC